MKPAEKWPSIPDAVFMSTPFCKAMGSEPTAAGGRRRSEWQRSAGNEPASSGEVSAGHRKPDHFFSPGKSPSR